MQLSCCSRLELLKNMERRPGANSKCYFLRLFKLTRVVLMLVFWLLGCWLSSWSLDFYFCIVCDLQPPGPRDPLCAWLMVRESFLKVLSLSLPCHFQAGDVSHVKVWVLKLLTAPHHIYSFFILFLSHLGMWTLEIVLSLLVLHLSKNHFFFFASK